MTNPKDVDWAVVGPAMARLLLELEWAESNRVWDTDDCAFCGHTYNNDGRHRDDCRWLAVMRAAGVRE